MTGRKDTEGVVLALLHELVPRGQLQGKAITEDTLLVDLGINSMARIAMAYRIEERLSIDLSEAADEIAMLRTVGDFITLLRHLGR